MAISLGTIALDLIVNHGQFLSGFSEAGLASKKFRSEFSAAFTGLGDLATNALAPLGAFGATIGATLAQIGQSGALAAGALGGVGGAIGALGTVGAVGAAGLAAVAAGSLALAAHTAESIKQMGELAQRTGVSVAALSGFAFVGKQVGVDTETMTRSLEKMNKAAFAAATAPEGAVNAFTRLHVAVRDSSGQIRSTESIFTDLAAKFAALPDGVTKTALAIQIFGRGGAAIIPVLNEGKAGVQEFLDTAKEMGVVLDPGTVEAATRFEQSLGTIEAAGRGASIEITRALLPALEFLADELLKAAKNGDLTTLVHDMAELTRITLGVGDTFFHVFEQIGLFVEDVGKQLLALVGLVGASLEALGRASVGDFGGAKAVLTKAYADFLAPINEFDKESRAIWEKNADFIDGIYGKRKVNPFAGMDLSGIGTRELARSLGVSGGFAPSPFESFQPLLDSLKRGSGGADVTKEKERRDIIAETIGKLKAQTAEEAALANAISGSTANTILATAAAEAEKTIIETNARAKLTNRALTEEQKTQIRDLTLLKLAYEAAYKDNKGLEEFIQKTNLQAKALSDLGAAYAKESPLAIEQAKEAEKLAPFQKQIDDIHGVIAAIGLLNKAMGASGAELAPLVSSLAQLQDKFGTAKDSVHALFVAEETDAVAKATRDIDLQTAALESEIPAILGGAAALRQYNIDQAVKKAAEANPLVDTTALRQSLTVKSQTELLAPAAKRVEGSQPFLATMDEIHALELLRDEETKRGADTSAIDRLLYDTRTKYIEEIRTAVFNAQNAELIGNIKLFDQQNSLIHQWDEMVFKVGTFGEKFRGVANEIILQGRNAGAALMGAFVSAIDGIETQFAKLLTGQKANFKQVFTNLAESIVKAEIQSTVGKITEKVFGVRLGGGKPDGSSASSALWVRMASGAALAAAGGAGTGGGGLLGKIPILGGILGKLGLGGGSGAAAGGATAPDGTVSNPFYVLDAAAATQTSAGSGLFGGGGGGLFGGLFGGGGSEGNSGGGGGGFLGTILSLFGGFLAEGGDMSPGKWYMAGERGPEAIVPKSAVSAVPFDRFGGPPARQINMTNNFNFPKDTDLFHRSGPQIAQELHRSTSIALSRG